MKIIKVRVKDEGSWESINNLQRDLYKLFHPSTDFNFRRPAGELSCFGYMTDHKTHSEAEIRRIIDKYFKNYKLVFKENTKFREERAKMYEEPVDKWPHYYYMELTLNKDDIPSPIPKKKYETSKIDVDKAEKAAAEINKKYPIGSGIRSRAAVGKKKGQFFIDVEIWNGPEEQKLNKDTFLPIIKKYFPKEKIRIYGAAHSRMEFSWYSYKYYILEK